MNNTQEKPLVNPAIEENGGGDLGAWFFAFFFLFYLKKIKLTKGDNLVSIKDSSEIIRLSISSPLQVSKTGVKLSVTPG